MTASPQKVQQTQLRNPDARPSSRVQQVATAKTTPQVSKIDARNRETPHEAVVEFDHKKVRRIVEEWSDTMVYCTVRGTAITMMAAVMILMGLGVLEVYLYIYGG